MGTGEEEDDGFGGDSKTRFERVFVRTKDRVI